MGDYRGGLLRGGKQGEGELTYVSPHAYFAPLYWHVGQGGDKSSNSHQWQFNHHKCDEHTQKKCGNYHQNKCCFFAHIEHLFYSTVTSNSKYTVE